MNHRYIVFTLGFAFTCSVFYLFINLIFSLTYFYLVISVLVVLKFIRSIALVSIYSSIFLPFLSFCVSFPDIFSISAKEKSQLSYTESNTSYTVIATCRINYMTRATKILKNWHIYSYEDVVYAKYGKFRPQSKYHYWVTIWIFKSNFLKIIFSGIVTNFLNNFYLACLIDWF